MTHSCSRIHRPVPAVMEVVIIATLTPGDGLKRLRTRAGLTTREVAELSQKIALAEGNEEYAISHSRIIQIENDDSKMSFQKAFTLSVIYGVAFDEIVSHYVDLGRIAEHRLRMRPAETRLADFASCPQAQPVTFPVRFDPGLRVERTSLLSRMVEAWGQIPAGLLQQLKFREAQYGFIGLEDRTMYPLLRPGSFVQIEGQSPRAEAEGYRSEFDRPIWFLELRDGYVCSWCEIRRDRVLSVPHPLSGRTTREFAYPRDVHIVGRVTGVAARIVDQTDADLPLGTRPPGRP